jgi:two-component system sensor histidine kinase QseC
LPPGSAEGSADAGESDVRDLAVAVWDSKGQLVLSDREGAQLTNRPNRAGFFDEQVAGKQWRVYYCNPWTAAGSSPPARPRTSATSWSMP